MLPWQTNKTFIIIFSPDLLKAHYIFFSWNTICSALQLHKATKEVLESVTVQENTLQSREDFFSIIDEYYATHDHDPCFGDDPYDIYDNDKERALKILKELLEEKRYDARCDADKSKTVYWGCVGLFDRLVSLQLLS